VVAKYGSGDSTWYLVRLPDSTNAWIFSGIVELSPSNAYVSMAVTVPASPYPTIPPSIPPTKSPPIVALRSTINGKYVRAGLTTSGGMDAVSDVPYNPGWEAFRLIDLGDGIIALQSVFGKYVRAGIGPYSRLDAVSDTVYNPGWEAFRMVDLGSGVIALQSTVSHKYVRAGVSGGMAAVSDAPYNPGWEAFVLVYLSK
jgi:hypothetical protein